MRRTRSPESKSYPSSVCSFNRTSVDSNFFRSFRVYTEARTSLIAEFALGLWRFNYVRRAFSLYFCLHVKLSTVDYNVDVTLFSIVGSCVVAHDDRTVWLNHQRRAVGETDSRPTASLSLDRVARVEFSIGAGLDCLASCRPHDANITFEGYESGAGWGFDLRDVFEWIAIFPYVECCSGGHAAEHKYGDHQIDEPLLNDPPIKGETTSFIGHGGSVLLRGRVLS